MSTPQVVSRKIGTVKQIVSGDTITIRDQPKDGPPPEKTICLSNIIAPKLARRAIGNSEETKDEPYAWEAREFLRNKLIGEVVTFVEEKTINNRTYGNVWLGRDTSGPSVAEQLVSEGLVNVKSDTRNVTPELQRLQDLENSAKSAGKGKWPNPSSQAHMRDIKWTVENPRALVERLGGKRVKAVIEHVRDGSTVRAFLLPDFYYVTLEMAGIRCPKLEAESEEKSLAKEAQYVTESKLLQRQVDIILYSANNNNFVGRIIHPKGDIAEFLLSFGYAECVSWSMNNQMKADVLKQYQSAEKAAKDKQLRRWKNYKPPSVSTELMEFSGIVTEIANADAVLVKLQSGDVKKVFLSSIRPPPRDKKFQNEDGTVTKPKDFRPLYDVPWMFEAREFLRKKLVGKLVKVSVDYIQPAKDNFPEKTCCTVTIGKVNIAEMMVSKGLATVVKYRQNDDQRSIHYSELLAAESKAEKSQYGLHAKKDVPMQRIRDVSTDPAAAKSHLQSLKRAREIKAVVEFVTSGSRLKLFVPKEYCLITFLLAGVKAPRAPRIIPGSGSGEGEPFGEEALKFTREHCLQKDVDIQVENMESKGSGFIGWLFVDGVNLSVALVEEGLATVSTFMEQGEHFKILKAAEERAKAKKLNIWKDYVKIEVETEKVEEENKVVERKINYHEVVVSEITEDLHFYAQNVDQRNLYEGLIARLRHELTENPPLPGAYNPRRGDMAAAKFTEDDQWYRVKIEKVSGPNVNVFYIDYGNRETLNVTRVAALPPGFSSDRPFASEYMLACVKLPQDNDYKKMAIDAFREDVVTGETLLLNVEFKVNNLPAATLVDSTSNEDVGKGLIAYGFLIVEKSRDRRLKKLMEDYKAAEDEAKKSRLNIWEYGDITEDDAKEFGVGR
ncbi:staphylococcal nuclease domain-containing protein 1 [Leptopilina boulardi]|uniref:staphylococcal nuclease domain-containing protein 1 n=1 Tax=Leptopilina boulardi TaxID=63433 RepID=UPI0021F58F02|nr:staphylococcal nuclease domain-containing protein 1 [Leptopilina boulardi]